MENALANHTTAMFWVIFVLILMILMLAWRGRRLGDKCRELEASLEKLQQGNRSQAVKHGKNWEQFAPFLEGFPGDRRRFRFLGEPIDGIIFDEQEIKFVEIKTGASQLSQIQRQIRELVRSGQVGWYEIRSETLDDASR